ncbi:hypothetical protein [Pedobacter sp. UC225_65]|uniref:hypothetical protein n=1 Tax=Pedobacter sp. UC225_65 TaxID=3350173 RepID=UPI00366F0B50
MKKQITLKHLLLIAALGFALLFIGSCKKELLTGNSPNSFEPIPSTKLTAVKQWYSRNEGLITSEFNWLNSLSPKWDSVRVQNNEKGSVYEAVLHNPDKIFATDGKVNLKDSRKKYAPKSSIRLLIFRDELGQSYRSCFMEIIATGESELPQQLSYKNYGNLIGLVSFYELDGRLANSWVYSNGKAVMSTSSNNSLKVGSSARSKSGANGRIMFEDGPPEGYIDCGNRLVAHTREVCGEVGGLEGGGYDGGEGSGKICREEMYFVSERIYCPIPSGGSGNGEYNPPNPTTPGAGGGTEPQYICNCACPEDNETIDASLSYEPKWGQLGNAKSIKDEVNKLISQTQNFNSLSLQNRLQNLRNYFDANRNFVRTANGELIEAPGSKLIDRYIYTENSGWIDMHHFFYAAFLTEAHSIAYAFSYTTGAEYIQAKLNEQQASAFSYEDLPSNYAGINFWKQYGASIANGTNDFNSALTGYFNQLNAREPSEAPNYDYIPHVIDNLAPKNTTSKGLVGDTLRNAAKESFCKKSVARQNAIKEAHTKFKHSSH